MVSKESLISQYSAKDTDDILAIYAEGQLTDMAFEIIEKELESRNVQIPERPPIQEQEIITSESVFLFLGNHWNGKGKLMTAFWGLWFLGTIILKLAMFGLEEIWYSVDSLVKYENHLIIGENILIALFVFFSSVALWRCAFNTNSRRNGYAARVFVGVVLLIYLDSMAGIFYTAIN